MAADHARLKKFVAAHPVEIIPSVGSRGRSGSPREHGALYGKQLLYSWILARLAPKL
jgi:hypothetical protein